MFVERTKLLSFHILLDLILCENHRRSLESLPANAFRLAPLTRAALARGSCSALRFFG